MHIVAPVCTASEVRPLAEAGATELFCGINPSIWRAHHADAVSSNQRPTFYGQVQDVGELRRMRTAADKAGVRIALALNRPSYGARELKAVSELAFDMNREAGIDTFIVADPGLIQKLVGAGFRVHVSSLAGVTNRHTVKFFAQRGCARIILPDCLTDDEIEVISQPMKPAVEIEAFVFSTGCLHIQGLCGMDHDLDDFRDDPSWIGESPTMAGARWLAKNVMAQGMRTIGLCTVRRGSRHFPCRTGCFQAQAGRGQWASPADWERMRALLAGGQLHGPSCMLCRLPRWRQAGLHAVKVIAREIPLPIRLRSVRLVRRSLDHIDRGIATGKFQAIARAGYRRAFLVPCPEHAGGRHCLA